MPTDRVSLRSDTIIEYIDNNHVPLIILKSKLLDTENINMKKIMPLNGWVQQARR